MKYYEFAATFETATVIENKNLCMIMREGCSSFVMTRSCLRRYLMADDKRRQAVVGNGNSKDFDGKD